jgi:hypothetical protein
MKLYELFDVVDDSTTLYITNYGDLIATYDGRNSIDERLNSWDVVSVDPIDSHSLEIGVIA